MMRISMSAYTICLKNTAPISGLKKKSTNSCPRARCATSAAITHFNKETDILDVWFDSGVSHAAVLEKRPSEMAGGSLPGRQRPAPGLVPQLAADRGGNANRAPYDAVLTHGFVVDARRQKNVQIAGQCHGARRK